MLVWACVRRACGRASVRWLLTQIQRRICIYSVFFVYKIRRNDNKTYSIPYNVIRPTTTILHDNVSAERGVSRLKLHYTHWLWTNLFCWNATTSYWPIISSMLLLYSKQFVYSSNCYYRAAIRHIQCMSYTLEQLETSFSFVSLSLSLTLSGLQSTSDSCVRISCVFPVLEQARKPIRTHILYVRACVCVHSHQRQHKALPIPHIFSTLITILFVVVFVSRWPSTFIPSPEISVIARRERQT